MHPLADEPLLLCEAPNVVPWCHLFDLDSRCPTCYNVKKTVCLLCVSGPWTMVVRWELESGPWPVSFYGNLYLFKGPTDFVEVYHSDLMTGAVYFCMTSN